MKTTVIGVLLMASVFAAPAIMTEMVSLPRVAYVLGRWFESPHDGFTADCRGGDTAGPVLDGHERVSVVVTCGKETKLSSILAGLDWVLDTAAPDATVVVPHDLRGHRFVEARVASMRDRGLRIDDAPAEGGVRFPADFLVGFAMCAALIAVCAGGRRLVTTRGAKPLLRRHTWEMSARDRSNLADLADSYAGQADDQAAARARRESLQVFRDVRATCV